MMAADAPSVSVVMPALDAESTIRATLDSVLRQSLAEFELIVVDDGSTDSTAEIVKAIPDPRVKLVQQEHGGAAAARNTGVRAARAPIVTLVDSDDLLLPRYLECATRALAERPDAGFVFTEAYVMDAETGRIRRTLATQPYRPTPLPRTAEELHVALIQGNFIYNAVSMPVAVLDRVGFFDESLRAAIDYEMWLRVAAYGFCAVGTEGPPLAVYRSGRRGSISSDRERVLTSMIRVYEMSLANNPGSAAAQRITRERMDFFAAELAAVRGRRSLGALRRRGRDSLARTRRRLRPDTLWFPRDAPPEGLPLAFPDLFPQGRE